jgi:hypothetical protein
MRKRLLYIGGMVAILAIIIGGIVVYTQPRTITTIEWPNKISAFGVIGGIAPGNDLTLYIKAKNPELSGQTIELKYAQPESPYLLTYDPFGTANNKIVPPVEYTPAPVEAANWFTINDTNDTNVDLFPLQETTLPFRINIPNDAQLPKNWYFYIEARDANEGGLVVSHTRSTVLVNMR